MPEPIWVVGAGGLLGQAVRRRLPDAYVSAGVPWHVPEAALEAVRRDAARFAGAAAGARWTVLWAAGASVVATDAAATARELSQFRSMIGVIRRELPPGGVFFLASSAGGLYAGGTRPPYDERSPVAPISPYGHLKLAQEEAVREAFDGHARVLLGRLANLYGPGQDLRKPQGLISQLCLAALSRRPVSIHVPLETLRDYLYADDAARLVELVVRSALTDAAWASDAVVLCSGQSTTISRLVALLTRLGPHRPLLTYAVAPSTTFQARDLRLRSIHDQLVGAPRTPLEVGIFRVLDHISGRLRAPRLSA